MTIRLGNDIIEVDRIANSIRRFGDTFLKRLFTSQEISYCQKFTDSERHFAGRFAAKEAISKALGCGIGAKLGWLDIEIISDEGPPQVTLSEKAATTFSSPSITLSISHCRSHATAVAIVTPS
jgi:holo-[acyl-carrier protein] synthase